MPCNRWGFYKFLGTKFYSLIKQHNISLIGLLSLKHQTKYQGTRYHNTLVCWHRWLEYLVMTVRKDEVRLILVAGWAWLLSASFKIFIANAHPSISLHFLPLMLKFCYKYLTIYIQVIYKNIEMRDKKWTHNLMNPKLYLVDYRIIK